MDVRRYEGKSVVIDTFGGNTFTGRITKVYENSVWMEEGYHVNIEDIRDCHIELERLERRYYKPAVKHMLSGLPLPVGSDGVVRDKYFVQCDFHPLCATVTFINCTFSGCAGLHYLENRKDCTTRGLTTFGG